MSDNGVYQRLAARFPAEAHKTKTIGGTSLTYVDGEMVVSRLNEELGLDGWSFEVKDIHVLENEVWALGRITVYQEGRTLVREQAGGQIINRKRTGEIIELSNDIKGAVTDCLKKCATLVGIGLYLYDPVERREVEQEMKEAKRAPKASPKAEAPASGPSPTKSSEGGNTPGNAFICAECEAVVTNTVTILKKKDGPKVTVSVADFAPVCEQRLGALYCSACYDRRFWGATANVAA
jgi:hypothetical protein